jgi:hypothetical protein
LNNALQESFEVNGSISLLLRKMPSYASTIKQQQKQYGAAGRNAAQQYAESNNKEKTLGKNREGAGSGGSCSGDGGDEQDKEEKTAAATAPGLPQRKHSFSALFLGYLFDLIGLVWSVFFHS